MTDFNSKTYFSISRPRFWIYLVGPISLCLAASYSLSEISLATIFLILYFTFPANLLIYGVNDIADRDTDEFNDKKGTYEHQLKSKEVKSLWEIILLTNLPFLILFFFLPLNSVIAVLLFLFFSIFYSLKPIRAKAIPFIDSIFNVLYYLPAVAVFYALDVGSVNLFLILAGTFWVMAMHAYSAVPDIEADKKAGLETSATVLGKTKTLVWCFILYLLSAVLSAKVIGSVTLVLFIPYATLMILSIQTKTNEKLLSLYKYFPFLNTVVGAILFFYIALQRF